MATLGPTLAQIRICTLRTILHHNIPLLTLQQPSLESMSLPQVLSHAPLAPPPARLNTSLEMVSSTGRPSPTGASGYVGSGYVRGVSHFISLLTHGHRSLSLRVLCDSHYPVRDNCPHHYIPSSNRRSAHPCSTRGEKVCYYLHLIPIPLLFSILPYFFRS
jgi:hypothetical protein